MNPKVINAIAGIDMFAGIDILSMFEVTCLNEIEFACLAQFRTENHL